MYLIVILSLWFILIFDIWMLCTKNLWCGKVITAWLTYIVCAIERMMWQFCFKASTTQKFHCHVTQAIVVRLKGRAAQLASLRRARVAPIELKCCTTIKWLSSSAVESQCAFVLARSFTLLATREPHHFVRLDLHRSSHFFLRRTPPLLQVINIFCRARF